jgi:hypothetical protein
MQFDTSATALPAISKRVPSTCPICGSTHLSFLGSKDFGFSGNDFFQSRPMFPHYGVDIPYYECNGCDFIFTVAFENWRTPDYRAHIYNEDYVHADPLFVRERPLRSAQLIQGMFYRDASSIEVLDFGGGKGLMANTLVDAGYKAQSFDAFYGTRALPAGRQFDLVSTIEVIEHVSAGEQMRWMASLAALLKRNAEARILLTTDLWAERSALERWFICPRNGHMSIHSAQSLSILAARFGLGVFSSSSAIHWLYWHDQGRAWAAPSSAVHDAAPVVTPQAMPGV